MVDVGGWVFGRNEELRTAETLVSLEAAIAMKIDPRCVQEGGEEDTRVTVLVGPRRDFNAERGGDGPRQDFTAERDGGQTPAVGFQCGTGQGYRVAARVRDWIMRNLGRGIGEPGRKII